MMQLVWIVGTSFQPDSFLSFFCHNSRINPSTFVCGGRRAQRFLQMVSPSNSSRQVHDVLPTFQDVYIFFIYRDLWIDEDSKPMRTKLTHGSWTIAPLFIST